MEYVIYDKRFNQTWFLRKIGSSKTLWLQSIEEAMKFSSEEEVRDCVEQNFDEVSEVFMGYV